MAISVAIFDDRIEIRSPGILPCGIRLDQLGTKQVSRNPFIAKVLYEMGYFANWGGGIKEIRDDLDEAGFVPPVFAELEKKLKVTFSFKKKEISPAEDLTITALDELIEQAKTEDTITVEKEYNNRQMKALKVIEKKGDISNKEYRFAFEVSNKTAYLELNELLDDGLILKKGAGRNTCYYIA